MLSQGWTPELHSLCEPLGLQSLLALASQTCLQPILALSLPSALRGFSGGLNGPNDLSFNGFDGLNGLSDLNGLNGPVYRDLVDLMVAI